MNKRHRWQSLLVLRSLSVNWPLTSNSLLGPTQGDVKTRTVLHHTYVWSTVNLNTRKFWWRNIRSRTHYTSHEISRYLTSMIPTSTTAGTVAAPPVYREVTLLLHQSTGTHDNLLTGTASFSFFLNMSTNQLKRLGTNSRFVNKACHQLLLV